MKLRRVRHLDDSWQKCCRWCKHYKDGKCFNSDTTHQDPLSISRVMEEGYLNETLEETLSNHKLSQFKELDFKLREWKISEKRIKEFNTLFMQCYDDWVRDIKEDLECAVDMCYTNHTENLGTYISDPENYCCKEWC